MKQLAPPPSSSPGAQPAPAAARREPQPVRREERTTPPAQAAAAQAPAQAPAPVPAPPSTTAAEAARDAALAREVQAAWQEAETVWLQVEAAFREAERTGNIEPAREAEAVLVGRSAPTALDDRRVRPERKPAPKRARRQRSWPRLILAAVALQVLIVVALIALADRPEPRREPGRAAPLEEVTATATNEAGGYSFYSPDDWRIERDGAVTKISSPEQDAVVAIGPAPKKNLFTLSEEVVEELSSIYDELHVASETTTTLGPHIGVLVEGRARNDIGARLRFFALTVEGEDKNFALTAFLATSADSPHTTDPVQQMLRSFRQSRR